jgi:UDP-arabinose 4-epimerase
MHFAALTDIAESAREPLAYHTNNVQGTFSLLRAMQAAGINRIVYSSTCAVYGDTGGQLVSENLPLMPANIYGKTKLAAEYAISDHMTATGGKFALLRYFNACGSDADHGLTYSDAARVQIIPQIILAALGDIDHLELFGQNFPTPDGTCIRDFIHVNDLARANVAALHALLGDGGNIVTNVGSGTGFSVRQMIDAVEAETGRPVRTHFGPERPGTVHEVICDTRMCEAMLGIRPIHSGLDNIIRTSIAGIPAHWRKNAGQSFQKNARTA